MKFAKLKIPAALACALMTGYAVGQMNTSLVTGIGAVYIHSANPNLAKWYSEKLGIQIAFETDTWKAFSLPSGTSFAVDVTSFPRSIVENQHVVISFGVKDIRAVIAEMKKRGVQFLTDAQGNAVEAKENGPLVATFIDADGNFAQISQAR